jgi:hypothetical protein
MESRKPSGYYWVLRDSDFWEPAYVNNGRVYMIFPEEDYPIERFKVGQRLEPPKLSYYDRRYA